MCWQDLDSLADQVWIGADVLCQSEKRISHGNRGARRGNGHCLIPIIIENHANLYDLKFARAFLYHVNTCEAYCHNHATPWFFEVLRRHNSHFAPGITLTPASHARHVRALAPTTAPACA